MGLPQGMSWEEGLEPRAIGSWQLTMIVALRDGLRRYRPASSWISFIPKGFL